MYFPTSAARQLSSAPELPKLPLEPILSLSPSPRKSFFCTLTRRGLTLWRVRPPAILAHLSRTLTSLKEHGENEKVHWSPDGTRLVIQTTQSFLILVSIEFDPTSHAYQVPTAVTACAAAHNFLPGPGEAFPFQAAHLHFEGVIRIEGHLLSVSPRRQYILYSTKQPSAIHRISWPAVDDDSQDEKTPGPGRENAHIGYDSWTLDNEELPWLLEEDVYLTHISSSKTTGLETWITSDGRAYFVRLHEAITSSSADSDGITTQTRSSIDNSVKESESLDSLASLQHFQWHGSCIHSFRTPRWVQKQRQIDPEAPEDASRRQYEEPRRAVAVAVNGRFSLVAVGTASGAVEFNNFPSERTATIPQPKSITLPNPFGQATGSVTVMEWTSDGYVLAVGWEHGWAVFSVGGRCLASGFGVEDSVDKSSFQDAFMYGVRDLFWAPGNFELIVLAKSSPNNPNGQIFVIPFAKSATTSQLTPDNTRYGFLQLDDRALIYRGADQPDMSVINPESDVWQHVKIPQTYLAVNWPVRYSSLSSDGRLVAVAGRRGLIHYSSTSGRWKTFIDEQQEQSFSVRGGLVWFHHVLIVAIETNRTYQIRLYSRDLELSHRNILYRENVPAPVVIFSLVDNSLLVYTADNTLYHYLIVPTADTITLHLCGSITFSGIIAAPNAVRALSWMIPSAQKRLGDPVDDLSVATVLMMVGGQLILLRPRKTGDQEVKYDMQIFAERIEFCWTHLRGIGALENSLWGYDGQGIRVWLNALAIESSSPSTNESADAQVPASVKESVYIPLDFYPLSVLMDKGIIIGAEYECAMRTNLPFVIFRHGTSSHLFLHHILRYHLEQRQIRQAVTFATHYQQLVFFAHVLEILLHTVIESDASLDKSPHKEVEDGRERKEVKAQEEDEKQVKDSEEEEEEEGQALQEQQGQGSLLATAAAPTAAEEDEKGEKEDEDSLLRATVEFLDHFDAALDVVVRCARKTEMTRWRRLFDVVGNPKALFETCLESGRLTTAASYLLILHNLEQLEEDGSSNNVADAVRLLKAAIETDDERLGKEILRFLKSIDETGEALKEALAQVGLLDDSGAATTNGSGSASDVGAVIMNSVGQNGVDR